MRRRSSAGGEPVKTRRRKTVTLKRRNARKPGPGRVLAAASLQEQLHRRTQELSEALEQQTATSEVLRVISSSPSDAQPVFDTIAKSVTRLCKAQFCHVFRFDGKLLHFGATHGYAPEVTAVLRATFPIAPGRGSAAARSILSGAVEEIPDILADHDYEYGAQAKIMNYRSIAAVPMLKDDRDRECAAVRGRAAANARSFRITGAADGHIGGSQNHQLVARRVGAGFSGDAGKRGSDLRREIWQPVAVRGGWISKGRAA
jgi:hypothetical protein